MGRVALVTGGSMGLGLALVTSLAEDGWTVIVDGRDPDDLASAVSGVPGPGSVVAVAGDVTDPGHRSALSRRGRGPWWAARRPGQQRHRCWGRRPSPRWSTTRSTCSGRVYEVNVVAPLALVQTLRCRFLGDGAAVVNITSDAAVEGYEGWGGYGSSKAALEQLSNVLAAEQPELAGLLGGPRRHEHPACTRRPSPARTSPTGPIPRSASPGWWRSSPGTTLREGTRHGRCRCRDPRSRPCTMPR